MSPNKTLYIRDEDMPLWERTERLAKSTRQSVSLVVAAALKRHLDSVEGNEQRPAGEAQSITVEVGDPPRTVGFAGRWLVEPHETETRTGEEGYDAGTYWGVALTKRGRIAVYTAHCNERWPATLDDFDSLDDVGDEVPEDILAMAAQAIGEKHVIWRDI